MFNVSALEILVVIIVALVVFGPERLPGLAKSLGAWARQARLALNHIKSEIDKASESEPPQKKDHVKNEPKNPKPS